MPCFLRAVTLDSKKGNRYDLAMVLAHLGETYASTGRPARRREAWDESLLILRTLHHPAAAPAGGSSPRCGGRAAAKPEVLGLPDERQAEAARTPARPEFTFRSISLIGTDLPAI